MNLPFTLPDWMPPWVFLLLALPVLLYALVFLLMPFSVFGVKARIEALEGQIETLHDDLRMIAMRASGALPPASTDLSAYDDVPNFGRLKNSQRNVAEAPAQPKPVPLVKIPTRESPVPAPAMAPSPRPGRRMEPRLD